MRGLVVNNAIDVTGDLVFLIVATRCSVKEYAPKAAPSKIAPASTASFAVIAIATFL
ncbi:unannotated protein [freshwater metagenome]|uniref:Unannotated protein n=1 Tax=freshwater metagenome TaxID=449393 RepID=A0A6J7TSA9_9ZZZZ